MCAACPRPSENPPLLALPAPPARAPPPPAHGWTPPRGTWTPGRRPYLPGRREGGAVWARVGECRTGHEQCVFCRSWICRTSLGCWVSDFSRGPCVRVRVRVGVGDGEVPVSPTSLPTLGGSDGPPFPPRASRRRRPGPPSAAAPAPVSCRPPTTGTVRHWLPPPSVPRGSGPGTPVRRNLWTLTAVCVQMCSGWRCPRPRPRPRPATGQPAGGGAWLGRTDSFIKNLN